MTEIVLCKIPKQRTQCIFKQNNLIHFCITQHYMFAAYEKCTNEQSNNT